MTAPLSKELQAKYKVRARGGLGKRAEIERRKRAEDIESLCM